MRDLEIRGDFEVWHFLIGKADHLPADFAEQVGMTARAFAIDFIMCAKAPDSIRALNLVYQTGIFMC